MAAALYIVLEKDIPEFDPFVSGKALFASEERLDVLAKKLGVTPLMSFVTAHFDEILAVLLGQTKGGVIGPVPVEEWFEAAEGLRTIRALRTHLGANPADLRNTQAVISELNEIETVLERVASQQVRWRLAVDS